MNQDLDRDTGVADTAHVVFSGRADLPWLRLLKPGFRHCFLILGYADCWLIYEPLSNRTEISILARHPEYDIVAWLQQLKFTVLPARIHCVPQTPAPWGPYTCVEAVKRALGVRRRRIVTPWRLYLFLREQNEKMLDSQR